MKKTYITVNALEKSILLRDITDQNNLPSAYNTTKRGFSKILPLLETKRAELEEMSMYSLMDYLEKASGLRFRSYCAMD